MTAPDRGVFITGTDTEAGKTVAAAAVLISMRAAGIDAVPMKPVQTGAVWRGGVLRSPDLEFCLRMAELQPDAGELQDMAPFLFEPACSPHLAAAKAGREISFDRILEAFHGLLRRHERVVVEGAGGLLAPITGSKTMIDLMVMLGLPVILAARPGLGTINHTLLSIREIERSGLELLGIIFCDTNNSGWGEIEENNVETIARMERAPMLGRIPYMPGRWDRAVGPPAKINVEWSPLPRCGASGGPVGRGGPSGRSGLSGPIAPDAIPTPPEAAAKSSTLILEGGPTARYREIDRASLWHPYTRHSALGDGFPVIARGEGPFLFDIEGNRYVDAISSWWACNLGHSHPRLVRAIVNQAGELQHSILGNLTHPRAAELAYELLGFFPDRRRRALFASDGASAVEAALRIAVQYRHNKGEKDRFRFAAFEDAYHGDTIGAMAVGYLPAFHGPYRSMLFPVHKVKAPDCAQCLPGADPETCGLQCFSPMKRTLREHAEELAAVIVEPLCLGAAGMKMYPARYLQRLGEVCREYGILLIVDEIAMGFGRTGRMFAFEHAGIDPDIVCLGKGLSGGCLPISAAVVKEEIFQTFADGPEDHTFYHGHTFAGNPIAAAAAVECLKVYREERIVEKAERLGQALAARFEAFRGVCGVANVRCLGMIAALDLTGRENLTGVERARRLSAAMLKKGVLMRPLGATVYLMLPLIADDEVVAETVRTLLETVEGGQAESGL